MIAREVITDTLPPVKSTDSASLALNWMNEFKISQLPIVDGGKYAGLITEDDVLDAADPSASVGMIRYSGWDSAYIYQGQHIYDAFDIMSNLRLEILPVVDEENAYLGVITLRDLVRYLDGLFAVREPGGILVLSLSQRDYMLSEIARIAESENAKILSLYLAQVPDSPDLILTLKLNVEDLSRVIASFDRFEYKILQTYHRIDNSEDFEHNLEALMKYLDM